MGKRIHIDGVAAPTVCDRYCKIRQTLQAISNSTRALLRASDEATYLDQVCRIVVNDCGYAKAWIGLTGPDHTLRPVAYAGADGPVIADDARGPVATAARTPEVALCRHTQADLDSAPWRQDALRHGYVTSIALPLLSDGQPLGALTICSHTADPFSDEEEQLLRQLADDLAEGLTALRLRAQLNHSLRRFELLAETAGQLLRSPEPQAVVESLCAKVMDLLDCQVFFHYLVDPTSGDLRLNACAGIPVEEVRRIEHLDYGVAVCGCVARDSSRIVAQHIATTADPRTDLVRSYGVRAFACHPLLAPGGRVIGTLSFGTRGRDTFSDDDLSLMKAITDQVAVAMVRVRQDQDLRASEAELRRANENKSEFLSVLSHELRNPLTPIKNSLYIMSHTAADGPGAQRALQVINRQVDQLTRLVDDLLDITRISRNKIQIRPELLNLGELVQRAIEDHRPQFESAQVQLECRHHDDPLWVTGDPARLAQVLGNLLQNAAKFTGAGGHAWVNLTSHDAEAVISVRDDGAGLAPEALARLFQPFMQVDTSLARSRGGLGLGLALVRSLVELHNGRITAHSAGLDQGSEFVMRLPLASAG